MSLMPCQRCCLEGMTRKKMLLLIEKLSSE